jgi:excisionase family DNA binding protein
LAPAQAPTRAYLTPDQVAELLQVTRKTVLRWLAEDPTMPALTFGRPGKGRKVTVRFPADRLLRWLRDRESGQRVTPYPLRSALKPAPGQEPAGA